MPDFKEQAAATPKSVILTPQTVALGIIDGVEENGSFSGTVLFSLSSEKNIKSVEILTPGLIAKNDGHKWLIDVAGHFKSHGRVVPVECQQPDSVEQVCVCTKAIADDGSFLIQSSCFARAKPTMKFAISGNKNFELLNDAVLDTRVLKDFSFSLQGKSGFTLKNCSLLLERIDGGKSEELYSRDGSVELAPGGRLWIKWYFLPPRNTLEELVAIWTILS